MRAKPYVIAIAGPSCSGKTALALCVAEALAPQPVARIALDAYYRDLSGIPAAERNFDAPDALDWPLLREQIGRLAAGGCIDMPVYSFVEHLRAPGTTRIVPGAFVVVEGLFALYDEVLRKHYGTAVFVEASHEVCIERRIARDTIERGRTRESVLSQFEKTVRPMAEQHILPTRSAADLIVNGEAALEASTRLILEHLRSGHRQM